MAHTALKYDSIRTLDKERGKKMGRVVPEMSIEKYMEPPPFWELGSLIKDDEEEEPYRPPRQIAVIE